MGVTFTSYDSRKDEERPHSIGGMRSSPPGTPSGLQVAQMLVDDDTIVEIVVRRSDLSHVVYRPTHRQIRESTPASRQWVIDSIECGLCGAQIGEECDISATPAHPATFGSLDRPITHRSRSRRYAALQKVNNA